MEAFFVLSTLDILRRSFLDNKCKDDRKSLLPGIAGSDYNEDMQDFEWKYVIDIFPILMIFSKKRNSQSNYSRRINLTKNITVHLHNTEASHRTERSVL